MNELRSRLRRPMTWMVVIEILLVAGLLFAAWRVWEDRQHPARAAMAGGLATPSSTATPSVPVQTPVGAPPAPPSAGPTPGLSLDPVFVQSQMQRLGGDESAMERLQWQLVGTVTSWARAYIDGVVVPAIDAAEESP